MEDLPFKANMKVKLLNGANQLQMIDSMEQKISKLLIWNEIVVLQVSEFYSQHEKAQHVKAGLWSQQYPF